VIGYRRARRADDLKTVSDLLNKIEKAYLEIIIFRQNQPPPPDKTKSENLWLRQYRRLLVESQLNLRYLTYLVRSKDITAKHLVDYCRSDMITYLRQLDGNYGWLEKYYPEFAKREILDPGFHQEVKNLEEFWKDEDIGVSRWRKIFRLK
jgi:hypothetical protein